MHWCLLFVAFPLLLSRVSASSTSFKTINITNGEQLKEYLCPPNNTIPPYTHLVIKHPGDMKLNNTGVICLVENTTNIHISGQQDQYQEPLVVFCDNAGGFGFFNVTIESIQFRTCGWWAIPEEITKYINGSDQFFYYDNAQTAFLFSHCYNLTLYNALGNSLMMNNISITCVDGVTLL